MRIKSLEDWIRKILPKEKVKKPKDLLPSEQIDERDLKEDKNE